MIDPLSVKIRVGPSGHNATVEIDGVDMSRYIAGFEVRADVHSATQVLLAFVDVEVEIDGTVDLTAMGNEWATYRLGKLIRDEIVEGAKA